MMKLQLEYLTNRRAGRSRLGLSAMLSAAMLAGFGVAARAQQQAAQATPETPSEEAVPGASPATGYGTMHGTPLPAEASGAPAQTAMRYVNPPQAPAAKSGPRPGGPISSQAPATTKPNP